MSAELRAVTAATPTGSASGVGLCLSGGGSRALTAGMGQMRALAHLEANGAPLLAQISALSTVSGGSWLGVPWIYLAGPTTDADYLNGFVSDPNELVLKTDETQNPAAALDHLPAGNPGHNIGRHFAIRDLVLQTALLRARYRTPWNMMWQVLIARHLLHPYGLYQPGKHAEPTSLFTLNAETLAHDVTGPNPELKSITAHLVASERDPDRMPRPFMICNTAMFVREGEDSFEYLAPVQATSLFTGILGTPEGVDENQRQPGGGGVSSFGFSSDLASASGDDVVIGQTRQWSLTDIVGASSAAFAEKLQNFLQEASAEEIHGELNDRKEMIAEKLHPHNDDGERAGTIGFIEKLTVEAVDEVLLDLDPKKLIPQYKYWPVRDITANPGVIPTRFADGGSLENTGIAGMLAHDEIHSIISCVNADAGLHIGDDDLLQVSSQIPVLFGLQPYTSGHGYQPYAGAVPADLGDNRIYRHNHVFEQAGFDVLLTGLRAAAGDQVGTRPAIFRQSLTTVDNTWFGVSGGRPIEVVWCLLNPASEWADQLRPEVRAAMDQMSTFPNYGTLNTQLSPLEVNLMSSQTAWCVANDANKHDFIELFS